VIPFRGTHFRNLSQPTCIVLPTGSLFFPFERLHPIENYQLRFGVASLKKRPFIQRKISRIVIHPNYKEVVSGLDIALIKLDQGIDFQHNVLPICLPTNTETFYSKFKIIFLWFEYSQTCVQPATLGTKKSGHCWKVVVIQRLVLKKLLSILKRLWIRLAVVDRWPLFRCGC
jgi:hypothetical protein